MLVPLVVVAPDLVEKLRAVEHLPRPAREVRQQIELPGGERDLASADAHAALAGLDPERAPFDRLAGARIPGAGRLGGEGLHAPEQRLHPRLELAHAEGLGEVVVRAHLQPEHAVELGRLRGEHQDRHVAGQGADLAADREAVHLREHQVEHHEVVAPAGRERQAALPVGGDVRLAPDVAQVQPEEIGDLAAVFDDEGAMRGHGRNDASFPSAAPGSFRRGPLRSRPMLPPPRASVRPGRRPPSVTSGPE